MRAEIAELRKDNTSQTGLRARQDKELKLKEAERSAEVVGAIAKNVVCVALGAIADAPCG